MTEQEAKQKRCCVYGGGAPAWVANPKSGNLSPLTVWMCIGSECMGWRWVHGVCHDPGVVLPEEGYCGRAGAP